MKILRAALLALDTEYREDRMPNPRRAFWFETTTAGWRALRRQGFMEATGHRMPELHDLPPMLYGLQVVVVSDWRRWWQRLSPPPVRIMSQKNASTKEG